MCLNLILEPEHISALGRFRRVAVLRKVDISFVMSVSSSVRLEQLGSHWKNFHEISYLSVEKD